MTWVLYLPPGKTTDIPRRHHWFFPRNDIWETSAEIPYWWHVTTEIWVVLLIGRATYSREFAPTNQKHYPDLGSDVSSVWNFFARFSDVISRANPWWPRDMSAVFWGHGNVQELLKVKSYVYQPCGLIKSRLFSTLCNVFWCSYRWTYCFARSDSSPILSLVSFFRGQVVTSRYHGSKISGYQQTAVLQICQKKQTKKKQKWRGWPFLAHTFLPSLDNADGRLCKERLLRSRNFASMVMWRHTSLLYYIQEGSANKTRVREDGTEEEEN